MEITIGKALEYSALGIAIVFALIIVLMIVVKIMSGLIAGGASVSRKMAQTSAVKEDNAHQDIQAEAVPAPGSAGDVKLYNVSDRDAAMIMAIVADQMQAPLNELRFLSIREVNEDEV